MSIVLAITYDCGELRRSWGVTYRVASCTSALLLCTCYLYSSSFNITLRSYDTLRCTHESRRNKQAVKNCQRVGKAWRTYRLPTAVHYYINTSISYDGTGMPAKRAREFLVSSGSYFSGNCFGEKKLFFVSFAVVAMECFFAPVARLSLLISIFW